MTVSFLIFNMLFYLREWAMVYSFSLFMNIKKLKKGGLIIKSNRPFKLYLLYSYSFHYQLFRYLL